MTPDYLRSEQRLATTVAALLFGPLFMLGPAVAGIFVFCFAPWATGVPVAAGLFAGSWYIASQMFENFHWVELDGNTLRGRKFWTRKLVEEKLSDLTEIVPLQAVLSHAKENLLIDWVTGTSNRGYLMRFSDGDVLAIIRFDMTGVDGIIAVVRQRWVSLRPAEANP